MTTTAPTATAIAPTTRHQIQKSGEDRYETLLEKFTENQDVRPSSQALYKRTLKHFFKWVKKTGRSLDRLTRVDILAYKESLTEDNLSELTQRSYIVVVRRFYEWAEGECLYPNIARGVKQVPKHGKEKYKKLHLTEDQSAALLSFFKHENARDFAMVNLMLRTGLRTIEVVNAKIGDITFRGQKRVLEVRGKARRDAADFVILTDKALEPLQDYLATRKGAKAGDPLFVSTSNNNAGKALSTRTISGICKRGLQAIGLDGKEYTAHSLRHTTATTLLKHGASLFDCQLVMRHSSPSTTEIYLESILEEQRLRQAPERLLDSAF